MAGGRYSYTAGIVSLASPDIEVSYWDYQAYSEYRVGQHGVLSALAFGAHDYLGIRDTERSAEDKDEFNPLFQSMFHRAELRYDLSSADTEWRIAAGYGRDMSLAPFGELDVHSDRYQVRTHVQHRPSADAVVETGADILLERFGYTPGARTDQMELADFVALGGKHDDLTLGVFTDVSLRIDPNLTLAPGLRSDVYITEDRHVATVEPRLMANYAISDRLTLTHGIGIANQPPGPELPQPGYRPRLKGPLQRAIQSSASASLRLPLDISAEVGFFQNILLHGVDVLGVDTLNRLGDTDNEETRSLGRSVGLELTVSRPLTRRLGGFVSYTLSRTERRAGNLSGPSGFDRTHVLNTALAFSLGNGYRVGLHGLFMTGIPARVGLAEAARSPPRTPAFYRIDWRAEKRWNVGTHGAWWALVAEMLNTTLNHEVLSASCYAYGCKELEAPALFLPSLGVEAAF